jgi:hypothetical protein
MQMLMGAPRQTVTAVVLMSALLAFEVFNFDTTKFALSDLLGEVSFLGVGWAAILAFAFCAIDFAGLVRIFTPATGRQTPSEVWYLMGAWLLGATMNAMMTWYAVALTLVNRPVNPGEVLTRGQLELIVPIFVAVLVWLTRILFIGSLSVASEQFFAFEGQPRPLAVGEPLPANARPVRSAPPASGPVPVPAKPTTTTPAPRPVRSAPTPAVVPPAEVAKEKSTNSRSRKRTPVPPAVPPTMQPTPLNAKSRT